MLRPGLKGWRSADGEGFAKHSLSVLARPRAAGVGPRRAAVLELCPGATVGRPRGPMAADAQSRASAAACAVAAAHGARLCDCGGHRGAARYVDGPQPGRQRHRRAGGQCALRHSGGRFRAVPDHLVRPAIRGAGRIGRADVRVRHAGRDRGRRPRRRPPSDRGWTLVRCRLGSALPLRAAAREHAVPVLRRTDRHHSRGQCDDHRGVVFRRRQSRCLYESGGRALRQRRPAGGDRDPVRARPALAGSSEAPRKPPRALASGGLSGCVAFLAPALQRDRRVPAALGSGGTASGRRPAGAAIGGRARDRPLAGRTSALVRDRRTPGGVRARLRPRLAHRNAARRRHGAAQNGRCPGPSMGEHAGRDVGRRAGPIIHGASGPRTVVPDRAHFCGHRLVRGAHHLSGRAAAAGESARGVARVRLSAAAARAPGDAAGALSTSAGRRADRADPRAAGGGHGGDVHRRGIRRPGLRCRPRPVDGRPDRVARDPDDAERGRDSGVARFRPLDRPLVRKPCLSALTGPKRTRNERTRKKRSCNSIVVPF